MAKTSKQVQGQQAMDLDGKAKKKRFRIPRGAHRDAEKSTSEKSVFVTKNGKEISVETSHGRFNRYSREIASGKSEIDGHKLTDAEISYRKGRNDQMGEQASEYKRKQQGSH